jgi:hypothetical protein
MEKIFYIKSPLHPEFQFEWHPGKKTVYSVRLSQKPAVGEVLAQNIPDHGSAINAVNIWSRGYRSAQSDKPLINLVA